MNVDDWIQLPNHPRSRDVTLHASAPHWNQARLASGPLLQKLAQVSAVEHDGVRYKLQGHTRAHLWQQRQLPRPETLIVSVYTAGTLDEFNALYDTDDNASTVRSAADRIRAAYRESKLQLRSERLSDGLIADALQLALRGALEANQPPGLPPLDYYQAVSTFASELKVFDALKPTPDPFFSGLVAAVLVGLNLYERQTPTFVKRLLENDLTPNEQGAYDPAQAVLVLIRETYRDTLSSPNAPVIADLQESLFARALRAVIAWADHHRNPEGSTRFYFRHAIRPVDVAPVIRRLKAAKGIEQHPNL